MGQGLDGGGQRVPGGGDNDLNQAVTGERVLPFRWTLQAALLGK